jgi:DNA-binding Xre family transcriptional regulator
MWKEIKFDFATRSSYFVSDDGKIMSVSQSGTRRILRGRNIHGHKGFDVAVSGSKPLKKKGFTVANVLLQTFKGNRNGRDAMVIDGDKSNLTLKNLKWMSKSEIAKFYHRISRLNKVRGGERGNYTLTAKEAGLIKHALAVNKRSVSKLAKSYGVTKMTIHRIARGECWGDIRPQYNRAKHATPGTDRCVVGRIKLALRAGKLTGKQIAEKYGVGEHTVSRIKLGKCYR